jgi:transcriptional regulator with XRE-family HTH domain
VAKIQLNLKMPAPLVARLREEAAAEGITLTALAERRLAGGYPAATSQLPDPVADRLAALEDRVTALEVDRSPRPSRRGEELLVPTPVAEAPHGRGTPDPTSVGDRLTTPELAELLGVGRSALNNWVARNQPGAERDGWRLVERVRPAAGGPPQWTWERATT